MRTAITVAKRHGESKWITVASPETPITTQLAEVKKLAGIREHKEFSDVEVWDSDSGRRKRLQFAKPVPKPSAKTDAPPKP